MAHIDRAFVGMALVWLMLGMVLGLWIGWTHSTEYLSMHSTMLLPGFVALAIYGVLYRLWPEMKNGSLARAQFWLASLGALGQVVGAWQLLRSGGSDMMLMMGSSVMAIMGGALMAWLFWHKTAEHKAHSTQHQGAW